MAQSNCSKTCASTPGCNHFAWSLYNSGTCWMKSGDVSKLNATYNGDLNMICAIIPGIIFYTKFCIYIIDLNNILINKRKFME